MATAVANRLTRRATPEEIESGLADLWREAGTGGAVSRALMANLVIFREQADPHAVDLTVPVEGLPLDAVIQRHPSRVIVLHHTPGATAPSGPIDSSISLVLFGPPQARVGVEVIAVHSACVEASLPSIVRRLALGDVPTSIWWTDDLSRTVPLAPLLTMGRQLVYDSASWRDVRRGFAAIAAIDAEGPDLDLADLNWRRLAPMRQALTQALGPALRACEVRATRVRVRHRPGDAAIAWLLLGWLASRLGWPPRDWPVTIEEARHGDEVLSVAFEHGSAADLTATMDGHRVMTRYRTGAAPFILPRPHEPHADAIVAELRTLTRDTCLHAAIHALTSAPAF